MPGTTHYISRRYNRCVYNSNEKKLVATTITTLYFINEKQHRYNRVKIRGSGERHSRWQEAEGMVSFRALVLVVMGLGHLVKAGEGGADLPDGKDGMDLM